MQNIFIFCLHLLPHRIDHSFELNNIWHDFYGSHESKFKKKKKKTQLLITGLEKSSVPHPLADIMTVYVENILLIVHGWATDTLSWSATAIHTWLDQTLCFHPGSANVQGINPRKRRRGLVKLCLLNYPECLHPTFVQYHSDVWFFTHFYLLTSRDV